MHEKELEAICRGSYEIEKRNWELQAATGSERSPLKQVVKWPGIRGGRTEGRATRQEYGR